MLTNVLSMCDETNYHLHSISENKQNSCICLLLACSSYEEQTVHYRIVFRFVQNSRVEKRTTMATSDSHYRIVGDITVKGKTSTHGMQRGKKVDISYGNKKTTNFENVSIIQTRQPLTCESPYFLVELVRCGRILSIYTRRHVHVNMVLSRCQCYRIDRYWIIGS
jgi:hypothetical protein